jgi:hypothetical protein
VTVSYSSGNFSVRDGEHTVADLVTAKGSPIATTDTVYIWTNLTKGIVGVGSGEELHCGVRCGWVPGIGGNPSQVGELKIYGGGKVTAPAAGEVKFNPGYGIMSTGTTSRAVPALFDANECTSDLSFRGAFACEHLTITNVKSGGSIDLQDATGYIHYLISSGKTNAVYSFEGIPGDGFFVRGADLGRVNTGLFAESGEPYIDLVTYGALLQASKSRGASLEAVPIPGRKAARIFPGSIQPTRMKLQMDISSAYVEQVYRDLDYIHANDLPVLVVTRSHGSGGDYPLDMLFRARIVQPLQSDPVGIDFSEVNVEVVGDE